MRDCWLIWGEMRPQIHIDHKVVRLNSSGPQDSVIFLCLTQFMLPVTIKVPTYILDLFDCDNVLCDTILGELLINVCSPQIGGLKTD